MKKLIKLFASLIIVLLVGVGCQLAMPWFSDSYLIDLGDGIDIFIACVIPLLLAIFAAVALKRWGGLFIPTARPEVKRIQPIHIVFGVILVQAAQIVVYPLVNLLPSDFMDAYTGDIINAMQAGFWPMLTVIFVLPILTEWLFRGIIQRTLVLQLGALGGIATGALFYALVHIMPQMMILSYASALVYGSIYFLTRSLTSVISVHVLANGVSYLLFLMFGSEAAFAEAVITSETMYVIVWTVSLLLLVATAFWVANHDKPKVVR